MRASTCNGARLIQDGMHIGELGLNGREGGLIIYHGVMLKVELESDGRFHSADGGATT